MTAKKSINGTYEMAALFFSVNIYIWSFGQTNSNPIRLLFNTCMLIAETVSKSAVISVAWWGQNITTRTEQTLRWYTVKARGTQKVMKRYRKFATG